MAKKSAKEAQSRSCDEYLEQHLEAEKHFEVSLSDIMHLQEYKDMCKGEYECTRIELFKFLFTLGLDTSRNVEEQYNTHRNKSNKVVTCPRWVGYQRTDKEWLDFKKG